MLQSAFIKSKMLNQHFMKEVGTHSDVSCTRAEICAGIDPSIEFLDWLLAPFARDLKRKQIYLENLVLDF